MPHTLRRRPKAMPSLAWSGPEDRRPGMDQRVPDQGRHACRSATITKVVAESQASGLPLPDRGPPRPPLPAPRRAGTARPEFASASNLNRQHPQARHPHPFRRPNRRPRLPAVRNPASAWPAPPMPRSRSLRLVRRAGPPAPALARPRAMLDRCGRGLACPPTIWLRRAARVGGAEALSRPGAGP
jgi:hypothetical protein